MNKKLTISIVAILIIFAVSIVWWQGKPSQQQKYTGPVEKITVGAPKFAPELRSLFFVAEARGYFKEFGLEVLIEPIDTSVEIDQAVSEGKIDIGTITDFTFVTDSFKKDNLQILAGFLRAYDFGQSHHTLRACDISRGSAGNESELFGIMTTKIRGVKEKK